MPPVITPSLFESVGRFFTIREVVESQSAARSGIDQLALLTPELRRNAESLAVEVLDRVREHYKAPVSVSSWFRSVRVNRMVGGSATSQHVSASACDFTVKGVTVTDLFNFIAFESSLPFDQVIHEFGGWVHVSHVRGAKQRSQRLRAYRCGGHVHYDAVRKPLE